MANTANDLIRPRKSYACAYPDFLKGIQRGLRGEGGPVDFTACRIAMRPRLHTGLCV